MKKWLPIVEAWARILVGGFGLVLATVGVIMVFPLLTTDFARWALPIALLLYYPAAVIVVYSEARNRPSSRQADSPEGREHEGIVQRPKQSRWLLLALVGLAIITVVLLYHVLTPSFVAAMDDVTAFFAAFAAVGAWVTGIALAMFAFQQWKLHRFEHSLSFTPEILLTSGGPPKVGPARENSMDYPYRVGWTVFVHNASQLPVVIQQVDLVVRPTGGHGKPATLSPKDAHIVGPNVFEVTLSRSQSIRWIAEGSTMPDCVKTPFNIQFILI